MKAKRFDCVNMMHRGAERIYRAIKGLSRDEELEFWRQKAAQLPGGPAKRIRKTGPRKK